MTVPKPKIESPITQAPRSDEPSRMPGRQTEDGQAITASLQPDAGPSPAAVRAVTLKLVATPLVRPRKVALVASPGRVSDAPPRSRAMYARTPDPRSRGADHRSVAAESAG